MTKTLRIEDETHEMLTEKIKELKNLYGVSVTIESVVNAVLRKGIPTYIIEKKE